MKKLLMSAMLAGGLVGAGMTAGDAEAAPLLGADGTALLGIVGNVTDVLAPVVGPVVGNDGVQGLLLPTLITAQGLLVDVRELPLVGPLLGETLRPVIGVGITAVTPLVLGVVTLDPGLIVGGVFNAADVVVSDLVPSLLNLEDGPLSGLLGSLLGGGLLGGDGDLLAGLLGETGLVGGLLGGNGGLLGGVLGDGGLVGGLLGGNGGLLSGVLGGNGLVGGLLGGGLLGGSGGGLLLSDSGLVGGLLGSNGLVGGLLGGDGGLLGGLLGSEGLVGGLLGGGLLTI